MVDDRDLSGRSSADRLLQYSHKELAHVLVLNGFLPKEKLKTGDRAPDLISKKSVALFLKIAQELVSKSCQLRETSKISTKSKYLLCIWDWCQIDQ